MFNLGEPSRLTMIDTDKQTSPQLHSFIMGPRSRGFLVEQMGTSHYVAIRFKPGGFAPFTRIPLLALTNRALSLDLIFGNITGVVEERLYGAHSPNEVVNILNEFLLQRFVEPRHHNRIIAILPRINDETLPISKLADYTGLSQKQFERRFVHYIGLMPKQYARIVRFNHMLLSVTHMHHHRSISSLALEFGYFDQSHLNKDFKIFTGSTPKKYFTSVNRIVENFLVSHAAVTTETFTKCIQNDSAYPRN